MILKASIKKIKKSFVSFIEDSDILFSPRPWTEEKHFNSGRFMKLQILKLRSKSERKLFGLEGELAREAASIILNSITERELYSWPSISTGKVSKPLEQTLTNKRRQTHSIFTFNPFLLISFSASKILKYFQSTEKWNLKKYIFLYQNIEYSLKCDTFQCTKDSLLNSFDRKTKVASIGLSRFETREFPV